MASDKLLTIGMATYDDYDGVYFSINALRLYHDICSTDKVEFLVVDNNPNSEHGKCTKNYIDSIGGKYVPLDVIPSSFSKYKVAEYASGKYVLIIDCHVLLEKNGIGNLLEYYSNNPDCKNLVQGPLWYDDLKKIATHFIPVWRGDMFGRWEFNEDAYNKGDPFEILMQGMGMLSFERKNWPSISPYFMGFGGEEGYISEKFRQNGGKNICLPNVKWTHRFNRPNGVPFRLTLEDRVWNYFIGWLDLYNDPKHEMIVNIYDYFKDRLPSGVIDMIFNDAKEFNKKGKI